MTMAARVFRRSLFAVLIGVLCSVSSSAIAVSFADDPIVGKMIAFIRAGGKRPLMRPRVRRGADGPTDDADPG